MNKYVSPFRDGSASGFKLGRMYGNMNLVGMTFVHHSPYNRTKRLDWMCVVRDVPDLDVIGVLRSEPANHFAPLFGCIDLNDGWITQIGCGRATLEIRGPATATRGASAVEFAIFRT